jgi:hypothetical protein
MASNPPGENKAPSPNLFDDKTPDSTLIKVPVGELRAALWYYNNYWIQKEKADELHQAILDGDALRASLIDTNSKLTEKNTQLEDQIAGWRTATLVVSGVTVGSTLTVIILFAAGVFH